MPSDTSPPPASDRRLLAIVQSVLMRPDGEREAYLAEQCGDDVQLAHSVRQMVARYGDMDTFLERSPLEGVSLGPGPAGAEAWKEFIRRLSTPRPPEQRYQDEGEIARGGMGAIRKVSDVDLHRTLAMKLILAGEETGGSGETDATLGRFLEEAQVTSQLDHPGIVPVHEIGVDAESRVYFTMKLVQGEDLRRVFDRVRDPANPDWTETRAVNVLLRVCEAMAFAHAKGVIHRDLKPANVMVGRFGEVYVMDWGLARVLDLEDRRDLRIQEPGDGTPAPVRSDRKDTSGALSDSPLMTMDGEVMGTPAYMPPEQAAGDLDRIGPRSDIYAVGAMLCHLLTGRMPYVEPGRPTTPHELVNRVRLGPPAPIEQVRADVPAELSAICDRAMSREIEARYPDMTALAEDLRAYLENRVVAAYESGPLAELRKWIARNRGLATTAAAALFLIAVLTTWFVLQVRTERDAAKANEILARASEKSANEQRSRAVARKEEFDQLAGVVLLETALELEDDLYPPWPDRIEAMRNWLAADAAKLLDLEPTLERTLTRLEGRSRRGPTGHPGDRQFDEESQQFLYDTLSGLSRRIAAFKSGPLRGVEERLAWAGRIDALTRDHPAAFSSWDEAREAIAAADGVLASDLYADVPIDLEPQVGLVPIGMNPVTLLWEFSHLRTAAGADPSAIPIPDFNDDGTLDIREETGLVFVLIPGGTYRVGAQASDPAAPHYDPATAGNEGPVREVTLEPFFLSRYEMTQAQWKRMTGANPSTYGAEALWGDEFHADGQRADLSHPVEQITWNECMLHLPRSGLRLPSEAQWEAACRAGTQTPWWTGDLLDDLDEAANLADRYCKANGGTPGWTYEESLDDGCTLHTRVGRFRFNPFGLHDTIGNVRELCLDDLVHDARPGREGDGARILPEGTEKREKVVRGGGYINRANDARSATRIQLDPDSHNILMGCRPARDLQD